MTSRWLPLLAIGVLASGASPALGRGDDPIVPAPPKAASARAPEPVRVDHVVLRVDGKERAGWPIDPEAAAGCILLEATGEFTLVRQGAKVEVVATEKQPVDVLPSAALVAGLGHDEEGVRDRCEELLLAQAKLAHDALGEGLLAASAEVRRRVLELLTQCPERKLQARIIARLSDPEERVRQCALKAYAALAPEDLLSRCSGLLRRDPAILVRHEAIVQLGRLADYHAVDPLLAHLDGCTDRSLKLVTFDALRRITGLAFGRDEELWRRWWDNHREEKLEDPDR